MARLLYTLFAALAALMGLANLGRDVVARAIGGDPLGYSGTATSTTATSLTNTGASFTASSGGPPERGGLVGHVVVAGGVYGTILRNTGTVLTIDHWHDPTAPETVAATPSGTSTYVVLPGGFPCFWLGVSVATRAFNAADEFLTNDGTTISELFTATGGVKRSLASWSHTNGTATYQVAKTFTGNANDTYPMAIAKMGLFQHQVTITPTTTLSGMILFQTVLSAVANLAASGDNVAITDTVTVS